MKKKLLIISLVLGVSSTAQAESSVTLYGTIDTGVGFQSFKNRDNGAKVSQTGLLNGVWSTVTLGD